MFLGVSVFTRSVYISIIHKGYYESGCLCASDLNVYKTSCNIRIKFLKVRSFRQNKSLNFNNVNSFFFFLENIIIRPSYLHNEIFDTCNEK